MYDVQFFIITLGLVATIIPIISELFILPSHIQNYKQQEIKKYKEQFRNTYQITFFYFLSISLTLNLYNYLNPINIEYFINDCLFFIFLIILIIFILFKLKINDYNRGTILLENKLDMALISLFIFTTILLILNTTLSIKNEPSSYLIPIDPQISTILFLSTIIFILLFLKIIKNTNKDYKKEKNTEHFGCSCITNRS